VCSEKSCDEKNPYSRYHLNINFNETRSGKVKKLAKGSPTNFV